MEKLNSKITITITIERDLCEDLRRKAQIFEQVLDFVPEKTFPIEIYSEKRIKEFLLEDKKEK